MIKELSATRQKKHCNLIFQKEFHLVTFEGFIHKVRRHNKQYLRKVFLNQMAFIWMITLKDFMDRDNGRMAHGLN